MVLLDTSVIVAAFTPDIHSEIAELWLDAPEPFLVSDWAAAEFSAAIRNKVRRGIVREERLGDVEAAFDAWTEGLGGRQRVLSQDVLQARAMIARRPLLRAPDAMHIVIAARLSARLATFDEGQAAAAALEAVPGFIL